NEEVGLGGNYTGGLCAAVQEISCETNRLQWPTAQYPLCGAKPRFSYLSSGENLVQHEQIHLRKFFIAPLLQLLKFFGNQHFKGLSQFFISQLFVNAHLQQDEFNVLQQFCLWYFSIRTLYTKLV